MEVDQAKGQRTGVEPEEVPTTKSRSLTYAEWVVVRIINSLRSDRIKIQNAQLQWGKFHENGNKEREISPEKINQIEIPAGTIREISAVGRDSSPTGTEGSIDLYDGNLKICRIWWNVPWAGDNEFGISDQSDKYLVSVGDYNVIGGALGNVPVEVEPLRDGPKF